IVIRVAGAFDCELRRFRRVKFEAEFAESRPHHFGGVGVGADERRFVAQFEEIHFLCGAHFFFPYSTSSDRPERLVVLSPLDFLILSTPRVMTPLFVQYSIAVSSVIRFCSNNSMIAISKVFQPKEPAASM